MYKSPVFMNKSTLIEILKDDSLLAEHSMESLTELEDKFPHFSIVKILKAKKARMLGSEKTRRIIHKAAVSGAARPQLFRILNDRHENDEEADKSEETQEVSPKDINFNSNASGNEQIDKISVDEIDSEVVLPYRSDSVPIANHELGIVGINDFLKKPELPEEKHTRVEVEDDLAALEDKLVEKKEIEEEMSKDEVMELIRNEVMEDLKRLKESQDKFQEKNAGISLNEEDMLGLEINRELIESLRIKIENFTKKYNIDVTPVNTEELSNEQVRKMMTSDQQNIAEIRDFLAGSSFEYQEPKSQEFVPRKAPEYTETMALLYEKQGAYDKAIDVYEQLKLKYPKKNTYFAHRIEVLRDRG